MKKIIILTALLCFILPVFPKDAGGTVLQVRINQIVSNFPNLEVYLSVFSKNDQKPITDLVQGNFSFFVDGKPIQPKVKTEIFRYTDSPVSYYVLFLGSGVIAFNDEAMNNQKEAVKMLIDKMQKGKDYLSLSLISEDMKPVFKFEIDKDKMISGYAAVEADMGVSPRLYDSIYNMLPLIAEGDETVTKNIKRKIIMVISDGRDTGSKFEDQFNERIIKASVPVYNVGISVIGGEDLTKLEDMSIRTGGNYSFARTLKDVANVVDNFHSQIMNTYVLKFRMDKIKGDDQDHVLKISVNFKDEDQAADKPFFAKKAKLNIIVYILIIVLILLVMAGIVFLIIITRRKSRAQMGITKRICPQCKRRMKDDWDECLFCKYLPLKEKEKEE